LFYLLALVAFSSCNSEPKNAQTVVTPTPTGVQGLQKVAAPTATAPATLIFNPPHGEAGHTCALAVGAPLNSTPSVQQSQTPAGQNATTPQAVQVSQPVAAIQNTKGEKLNPAHGEPNHRCDIPVGAPLNSKPTQVVQTTQKAQPLAVQNVVAKNGDKLNPAHGQPNHRCDIAVGAPLNSKPLQAAQPAVVPATENKVSLDAQNGVKLNPKHGEPGHRCDLAVGAPLT